MPHDHPWNSISFPLTHDLIEHGADGKAITLKRLRPKFRQAEQFHRLVVDEAIKNGAWTFFVQFRWRREWGFMSWPHGYWVPAKDFLMERRLGDVPQHPNVGYGLFVRTTHPDHHRYPADVKERIAVEMETYTHV